MNAEINLIGTGGGWGESIIINLGNDEFIIVDSCIDPNTKEPLPVKFLKDNKIEFEKIKIIVCTHWHDDHIRGLSELLKLAVNSSFCFAKTSDLKKFFLLLSFDYAKEDKNISNSSTIEFNKCLEILKSRNLKPIPAYPNRIIYNSRNIEIRTLSPSDYSIELFDNEISNLIADFADPNKSIVIQKPNDKSVALFLKLGEHNVILGADLEVNSDNRLGWGAITNQSLTNLNTVNYFKIPHHGSQNGYSIELWNNILTDETESTLTPYNKGSKLPKREMVNKYLEHTPNLHITSDLTISSKPKKRDSKIEKDISPFTNSLSEIRYSFGIITSKINIFDKSDFWKTSYQGSAKKLK